MNPCHRLTNRECEVLDLLAKGMRNRQIAELLVITEGTVEVHLHNIFQKLDVSTRTEAALRYTLTKRIATMPFLAEGVQDGDDASILVEMVVPRAMVEWTA